jgi:rRNA-processing protein FCF1
LIELRNFEKLMNTEEIIKEIKRLPSKKRVMIEIALKEIRKAETDARLRKAADELYDDYANDLELTALTVLDSEEFYEPR